MATRVVLITSTPEAIGELYTNLPGDEHGKYYVKPMILGLKKIVMESPLEFSKKVTNTTLIVPNSIDKKAFYNSYEVPMRNYRNNVADVTGINRPKLRLFTEESPYQGIVLVDARS
ncbi:hypothetical protein GX50_05003 [[Emmonsia] crescens]|uniref:Uncharacterized protein n=1 Tax=[Emmonsia] crescens TaxID=73230 RepID=A0A2B7ZGA5_9EURO|nr:hypothetical protein GX50_05003 [Emmonsia crescens]